MGALHAWQANIVNTHAPTINVQNKANSFFLLFFLFFLVTEAEIMNKAKCYKFRAQTERLNSAMVRSTDAARWPLRDDFEDLAPLRHIMEV